MSSASLIPVTFHIGPAVEEMEGYLDPVATDKPGPAWKRFLLWRDAKDFRYALAVIRQDTPRIPGHIPPLAALLLIVDHDHTYREGDFRKSIGPAQWPNLPAWAPHIHRMIIVAVRGSTGIYGPAGLKAADEGGLTVVVEAEEHQAVAWLEWAKQHGIPVEVKAPYYPHSEMLNRRWPIANREGV